MLVATEMPRKPKPRREEIKVNYRLAPEVKNGVFTASEISGRSENLQAEYLLKVGLLAIKNIDISKMTDEEINVKFSSIYGVENKQP